MCSKLRPWYCSNDDDGTGLQLEWQGATPFPLPFRSTETSTTTGMYRETFHTLSTVRYRLSQNEGWMSVSCEIGAPLHLSHTFRMLILNGRCTVRRNYGVPDAELASTMISSCAWPGGAAANPRAIKRLSPKYPHPITLVPPVSGVNLNVRHTEATTAEKADQFPHPSPASSYLVLAQAVARPFVNDNVYM